MFEREEEEIIEKQKEDIKRIAKLDPIGVERFIGTERRNAEIIRFEELKRKREREKRNTRGRYEITSDIGKGIQLIFSTSTFVFYFKEVFINLFLFFVNFYIIKLR